MKKLLLLFVGIALISLTSLTDSTNAKSEFGYVYVYFQNDCSSSVKYEIKYPGHGSSGSISANSKKRMTIRPTAKVYIDGDFYREVESSDDKKTWVVCK